MSFVDLLIFIFGCTGLTVILVLSVVMEPVRAFVSSKSTMLGKLISCTMCSGFWIGLIISLYMGLNPLLGGAISSLFSWSVSSVVESIASVGLYFDTVLEDGDENDEGNSE